MKRRQFICLSGTTAVGFSLERKSCGAAPKARQITLGYSTYAFPKRTAGKAIALVRRAGFDAVELWAGIRADTPA